MEGDQEGAAAFPVPPSPSAGAAALPLWDWGFVFTTAREQAVHQPAAVIKPPDAGDVALGYCTFLETAELEKGGVGGGCSDKITGGRRFLEAVSR